MNGYHLSRAPKLHSLIRAEDNCEPVTVDPRPFVGQQRDGGWGGLLDVFLSQNGTNLEALAVEPVITSSIDGVALKLKPYGHVGAIPLKAVHSGQVTGGLVVTPRFGWSGIGRVLSATGWGSGPNFLAMPMVPGSGREVPPWVLAGPVLQRLADFLTHLKLGYRERVEVREQPRGQVLWERYVQQHLAKARWHQLPCRYSELDYDTRLKQAIRWTLERLQQELIASGGADAIGLSLADFAVRLLEQVSDVTARRPGVTEFGQEQTGNVLMTATVREGLRAIGWIAEEKGLGGGQTSDGLAWSLPLDNLWERYVESIYQDEARVTGGRIRIGRMGETTIPIPWSSSQLRGLGHLVPDIVIHRHNTVQVVDAKYKAHFADLDTQGWFEITEEQRNTHRADLHQVLAYAAAFSDAEIIIATLVYPVSKVLFEELTQVAKDTVRAEIPVSHRRLVLEMRALSFGR